MRGRQKKQWQSPTRGGEDTETKRDNHDPSMFTLWKNHHQEGEAMTWRYLMKGHLPCEKCGICTDHSILVEETTKAEKGVCQKCGTENAYWRPLREKKVDKK
jgi:hypothetical protein